MLRTSFIRRGSIFALAAALAITSGALVGCSGGNNDSAEEQQGTFAASELPLDEMQAAFEGDSIVKNGVASDAYLNPSPYKVTSFEVTNNRDSDDGTEYEIKATIENDNYVTEMTVDGLQQGSRYEFDVVDSTTTPKKGIDYDSKNVLEDTESVLSDDGKSCTVETSEDYDYWFVEGSENSVYTYKFDGNSWSFDDVEQQSNVTYKDLDGTYSCPAGETTQYENFTISNLDPKNGTFDIAFTMADIRYDSTVQHHYFAANVTERAGIDPVANMGEDSSMDNGLTYTFKATGESDQGNKASSMNGYIGVDSTGKPIIFIENSTVATLYEAKLSWEPVPEDWDIDAEDNYVLTKN